MTCDVCGARTDEVVVRVSGDRRLVKCWVCNQRDWDQLIGDAPPTIWDIPSVRARWET